MCPSDLAAPPVIQVFYGHPKGSDDGEDGDGDDEVAELRQAARAISRELAERAALRGGRLRFAVTPGLLDWQENARRDRGWYGWPAGVVQRYAVIVVEPIPTSAGLAVQRGVGRVVDYALAYPRTVLVRNGVGPTGYAKVVEIQPGSEDPWALRSLVLAPPRIKVDS